MIPVHEVSYDLLSQAVWNFLIYQQFCWLGRLQFDASRTIFDRVFNVLTHSLPVDDSPDSHLALADASHAIHADHVGRTLKVMPVLQYRGL